MHVDSAALRVDRYWSSDTYRESHKALLRLEDWLTSPGATGVTCFGDVAEIQLFRLQ